MSWMPEHRRRYAPTVDHRVRASVIDRLAATIDPPTRMGRPRLWSTLIMLAAPW